MAGITNATQWTAALGGVRNADSTLTYPFSSGSFRVQVGSTNQLGWHITPSDFSFSPEADFPLSGQRFALVWSVDQGADTLNAVLNGGAHSATLSADAAMIWSDMALGARRASLQTGGLVADLDFFAIYPGALDAGGVYDALFDPVTHALRGQPGAVPPGVLADVMFFRVSGEAPSAFAQNRGTTGGEGTIVGGTLGEPS